jgi:hypothetical protein
MVLRIAVYHLVVVVEKTEGFAEFPRSVRVVGA